MSEDIDVDEVERELRRVVDRLMTLSLARAETARPAVMACASTLVERARSLGVPVPVGAELPDLGPQGLGPMIAVLGQDVLDAARAPSDLTEVLDALVTLRRALP